MATFATLPSGEVDDGVRIVLNGKDVFTFEDYEVRSSILTQPSQFSVRLSARNSTAELLRRYPPRTPFVLKIGDVPQFTGETDGFVADGDNRSTTVTFSGRDLLARLFSNDVDAERAFNNISLEDLTKEALKACGLEDRELRLTNALNLRKRTGLAIEEIAEDPATRRRPNPRHITAKMGESWLSFLQRHLAKQGLFIWSDVEGGFVVARPRGQQRPLHHAVRRRGQERNLCNIERGRFTNDTTKRASRYVVFARNLGRRAGFNHTHGFIIDPEMVALGYERVRVYRDTNVSTAEQAEEYARRKMAEVNRASWKLEYTFSGHTGPAISGGRAVLTPDTVMKVDDDEYNLRDNYWLESVIFRSPPRTAVVTLMRVQDLVFGVDD